MTFPSNRDRTELCRVVLRAQFGSGEEKPENLWIGPGRPASDHVKQQEHQNTARQAIEQIERACANTHREEKQLPLSPENREGPRERTMYGVDPSGFCHDLHSF